MPSRKLRRRRFQAGPGRQPGIALIVVLWGTLMLSVLAAGYAKGTRTETVVAQQIVRAAQARALAEAAIYTGIHDLFKPVNMRRFRADGTLQELPASDAQVALTVQDVAGLIDINSASEELLDGALRAAGLDTDRRAPILDAILDWRDKDNLHRQSGAEDPEYERAGVSYGAKDGPFDTVEELQQVLGLNQDIYKALKPLVTVYSKQPGVNQMLAPAEVLRAIPGVDPAQIASYIQARATAAVPGQGTAPPPPFQSKFNSGQSGQAFILSAQARVSGGGSVRLQATVRLLRQVKNPFSILSWREG